MSNNRFYWIKLKTNFFNREDIDFLLSQKNGAEYVVLYQMLCLNTANNNGRLETKMGEIIIPYNADKIVRDCKYFDMITNIIDFSMINVYKRDLDYLLPHKNIVAILCDKKELSINGNSDIFTTIIQNRK